LFRAIDAQSTTGLAVVLLRGICSQLALASGAGLLLALHVREMQTVVKGMVQVHGVTYRIARVRAGQYEVVRVLDDVRIGLFSVGPHEEAVIQGDTPDVVREVARVALQGGRTTWVPRRLSA
jgi:hypothetical protein